MASISSCCLVAQVYADIASLVEVDGLDKKLLFGHSAAVVKLDDLPWCQGIGKFDVGSSSRPSIAITPTVPVLSPALGTHWQLGRASHSVTAEP
jgi:hypothetical protein